MSFSLLLDGESHDVEIIRRRPHLLLRVNGRDYAVQATGDAADGAQELVIDGRALTVMRAADGDAQILRTGGQSFRIVLTNEDGHGGSGANLSELHAPMPGTVIEIHVTPGDRVSANDPLITIESMKLQTVLGAPRDGIVAEVAVTQDELFGKDQILVRLEAEEEINA